MVLVVKNLPANAGDVRDMDSIPGSERSPGGGHGKPLQYSCLEHPMDRGAWQATVHRVAQRWTWLKRLSTDATSNSNSRYRPKRNESIWPCKNLHMNVHNSFIYNSWKAEISQKPIKWETKYGTCTKWNIIWPWKGMTYRYMLQVCTLKTLC